MTNPIIKYKVGYTLCKWTIVGQVNTKLVVKHEDFDENVVMSRASFITAINTYIKDTSKPLLDSKYRVLKEKCEKDAFHSSIVLGLLGNPLRYFTLSKVDGLTYYWVCNKCGKIRTSTFTGVSEYISEACICCTGGEVIE